MAYEPRYTNLVASFEECTARYADRPLFGTRKVSGWEWTTYKQFRQQVDRARGGLAALGVGPGDKVAVISNNRLEWAVCAYGTYTRGAIYVPMYEAQLDKEWAYILQDSGAKVCLVAGELIAQRVTSLKGDCPHLEHVVDFTGPTYAELMRKGGESPVEPTRPADADLASLIYTSGTTGNPKGVELSHHNLAANVSALLETAPVKEGDRSLAFLPWAHVFGGSVELNTLIAIGGTIAICDDVDNLLQYLPEVKPTMLFAVPRIWNRIYDGVQKQVAGRPKVIQNIFHAGLSAKAKAKKGQALSLGERVSLPLAEKLIFSKIGERFGGDLRFAFSGAAALSPAVADIVESFCCVELYLPDFLSKILPVVRPSKGRTWFYANWGYEESKHSLAMGDWLLKSGHRSEEQMKDLEQMVFSSEWNLPYGSHLGMLAYAMVQEHATFINYRNLRQRASELGGDPALQKLLSYVGVDESSHYGFFRDCLAQFLKYDRDTVVEQLRTVLNNFRMPAIHDLLDASERRIARIRELDIFSETIYYGEVYLPVLRSLGIDRSEMREGRKARKSAQP